MTSPIVYKHSPAGIDTRTYDTTSTAWFRGDSTLDSAGIEDLEALAASPDWEDRVRAQVLLYRIKITLPDDFPCLYEVADSPSHEGHANKRPHPWVKSPDIEMLQAVLPDYQRLWDSYTSQWGPKSRRVFSVGRLDGLSPNGLMRPGATPADVIAKTLLTHTDMYRRAPEDLRAMHPSHPAWTKAREKARRIDNGGARG